MVVPSMFLPGFWCCSSILVRFRENVTTTTIFQPHRHSAMQGCFNVPFAASIETGQSSGNRRRALACCFGSALLFSQADLRIPSEVRYKSGYINAVPKPPEFSSAMLWGIAIADTRVPDYREATIEIARSQLTCRADGRNFVLNDDEGTVRGGLYRRSPWFGTDVHDPMPLDYSGNHQVVILHVGIRHDRVWHFWAASPRGCYSARPFRRMHGENSCQSL
jgi:hypothetical protein